MQIFYLSKICIYFFLIEKVMLKIWELVVVNSGITSIETESSAAHPPYPRLDAGHDLVTTFFSFHHLTSSPSIPLPTA